jgi:hypothetical protein
MDFFAEFWTMKSFITMHQESCKIFTTALDNWTSQLNTFEDDQSDDSACYQHNDDDFGNEFDFIIEEYEMHQDCLNENLDEANCKAFLHRMKDSHIISDPIFKQNSGLLTKDGNHLSSSVDVSEQMEQPTK